MYHKGDKYPTLQSYNYVMNEFKKRNITITDLAKITYALQHKYNPNVQLKEYELAVNAILHRHDVLSNAMVAFNLDNKAQNNELEGPLQMIVQRDFSLFGVDEGLALNITNLYGTIGITNFGYVDKVKKGTIKRLDEDPKHVTTFTDDIVGAIAVAAGAKMAHSEDE